MTPELSRQLGRLFSLSAATPHERESLVRAATAATVATLADLPPLPSELAAALQKRVDMRREALDAKSFKHLPGQHNQQDHAGISSLNALNGITVYDAEKYADLYGDAWDDAGVDLGNDGDVMGLNARYFENGDLHVVLDLEDDKHQVLEDMDPESMRRLSYDIDEMLAVDETEFAPDDPYDIVADVDSGKHSFYIAKDGVGDIRIQPAEAGDDYLEMSEERAEKFAEALRDIADSYEEHFAEDIELVPDDEAKARVKHPGHPDQSVHGRRRTPKPADLLDAVSTLAVDPPKPKPSRKPPKPKPPKPAPVAATPAPKPPKPRAASRSTTAPQAPKTPRVEAAEEHVKKLTASLPPALRKPVTDALLVQAQIAPGSMMKLRGLGTADLGGSGAKYKYPAGIIDINSRWQTNKRGLDASFKASRADGYLTPSGSPTQLGGAVAHEFGHRVAFRAIDPTARGMQRSVVDKVLGPFAAAIGTSPPSSPRGDLVPYPVIEQWMMANRLRITSHLSEYGAESVHEMLAEAWQEFSTMGDKARPAAKAVGGAFLKMFEGGGS